MVYESLKAKSFPEIIQKMINFKQTFKNVQFHEMNKNKRDGSWTTTITRDGSIRS